MTGYRWSRKRWVPEPEPETSAFKALLGLFDLERLDRDLFLGDPGPGEGRLFGGLVAAQSVLAASLTVEEGHLHSLHSYFLRPGRHDSPLRYVVDQIRNGRTFTTRRVVAMQGFGNVGSVAALTLAERGLKIMPLCPFAKAQFEKHPEWKDVLR